MKRLLAIALVAAFALVLPALSARSVAASDIEPCDPAPSQLLWCKKHGGAFIGCRCVLR